MAAVFVDGTDLSTITDDSGRFHVGGIAPGRSAFTVRRVGYAPVSFETILEPDRTLVLDVRLRTLQTLDRVVVSGERRSTDLARTGFYDRQHAALGSFISPQRVDSLSRWVTSSAQLLRDTRGLDVTCTGGRCGVSPRMPPNCLNLFVDGALTNAQMDDVLTLGVVAAIEVYERPIIVPAEFQGPLRQKRGPGLSVKAGCGAIAVWTKSRVRDW